MWCGPAAEMPTACPGPRRPRCAHGSPLFAHTCGRTGKCGRRGHSLVPTSPTPPTQTATGEPTTHTSAHSYCAGVPWGRCARHTPRQQLAWRAPLPACAGAACPCVRRPAWQPWSSIRGCPRLRHQPVVPRARAPKAPLRQRAPARPPPRGERGQGSPRRWRCAAPTAAGAAHGGGRVVLRLWCGRLRTTAPTAMPPTVGTTHHARPSSWPRAPASQPCH